MEFTSKEIALYQWYMKERDACMKKAHAAFRNHDIYMFTFWSNASREFERRARDV